MFAGSDRTQTREVFFRAWRSHREGRLLAGLEQLIVQVALRHPEYHALLDRPDDARDRDYALEAGVTNPFLHLGLHIAIEEQLSLDQPRGIRGYYQKMLQQLPDEHAVQHRMMECLEEMLWRGNREAGAPEESAYLDCLRRCLGES